MGHMHNCGVSDPAIPRAPLPLPRYVRAAVIGPASGTGRHDLLRQAMAAGPLLDAMLEPPEIETLTSEMLAVNTPFLPQSEL
jgi:hypothetical protein